MIRLSTMLVTVAGLGALAGMYGTNPDYNRALQPFVVEAGPDGSAATRVVSGRIDSWRLANAVEFQLYGQPAMRDTSGVVLIVDLLLEARDTSVVTTAVWQGASDRRYQTTDRIDGPAQLIGNTWLQPGLPIKTTAVFELPPDEVAGGSILIGQGQMLPLDGQIRLYPPEIPPSHRAVERMGEP